MLKKLKIILFVSTFLTSANSWSQQFDVTLTQNTGGYAYDDPAIFREFIHCKSVNNGSVNTAEHRRLN